jgi:rod shape-determining protein MreD
MAGLADAVRRLFPAFLACFLVLFDFLPAGQPLFAERAPLLGLMAVYYWSLYRPELLPQWLTFGLGLLSDALSGGPLGAMALVFLGVRTVCIDQRKMLLQGSFAASWLGFAAVAASALALLWLLVALVFGALIDPRPALWQLAVSVALYPSFVWLLNRFERLLPQPA